MNEYEKFEKMFRDLNNRFRQNELTFKQLVDEYKNARGPYNDSCLIYFVVQNFLNFDDMLKELIENDKLTREDLKYLLDKIETRDEVGQLTLNHLAIKHILKEFVLDKKIVDKFNKAYCWGNNTIFDSFIFDATHHTDEFINWNEEFRKKPENEIDKDLLELIDLNKAFYSLNTFNLSRFNLSNKQRFELIELIKNNEIALNRVKEIADNHLEDNYDFDSLMSYLKKKEKKNVMNV